MTIRRRDLAGAAIIAALGCAALAPAAAIASPAAPARDRPPECNLVKLYAPSGRAAWIDFCGGAGGQESPVQDWARAGAKGGPLTMDGIRVISPAACPRPAPCVVLAENAPPS
jgi:hypothetical protein